MPKTVADVQITTHRASNSPWSFPETPHKPRFNRQDAKYAKFPRRCLSAGENIEFVGLGDLGVLAVGQIVKLQEKTMSNSHYGTVKPDTRVSTTT
ncbi:MAG: hypothetical protein ACOYOU_08985 [Kiritimatiellia bacterium]